MLRRTARRAYRSRPPGAKTNPNEAKPGHYDKSMEKVIEKLERSHPRNKMFASLSTEVTNSLGVSATDHYFGEDNAKRERERDVERMQGKESESLQSAKIHKYFSSEGWDEKKEVFIKKSADTRKLERKVDPELLKSTNEKAEYYYPTVSLAQKAAKRNTLIAAGGAVGVGVVMWVRWLMRSEEVAMLPY